MYAQFTSPSSAPVILTTVKLNWVSYETLGIQFQFKFYYEIRMHSAHYAITRCPTVDLSVRSSVTCRYSLCWTTERHNHHSRCHIPDEWRPL